MRKIAKVFFALLILIATFNAVSSINMRSAYAAWEVVNEENYVFGTEDTGSLTYIYFGTKDYKRYCFTLTEKSYVFITVKADKSCYDINVYDVDGNIVSDNETNTMRRWNDSYSECNITHSCSISEGDYYIDVHPTNGSEWYRFIALAEPVVSLSTPVITELTSDAAREISVFYSNVPDALVYEVQYSKDPSFSSYEITETPSDTITISNLDCGTYYYVRVRAYTVYNDGNKVYSNWSRAQSVLTKKAENKVTIYTTSKTIKSSALAKNNQSFFVAVEDLANAELKYTLTAVSSSAKGYISINKSDGTITVKKGLKKGKYTAKITVEALESSLFEEATTTKSITIKIE